MLYAVIQIENEIWSRPTLDFQRKLDGAFAHHFSCIATNWGFNHFFPTEFYCCINLPQSQSHRRHCAINLLSATELQVHISCHWIIYCFPLAANCTSFLLSLFHQHYYNSMALERHLCYDWSQRQSWLPPRQKWTGQTCHQGGRVWIKKRNLWEMFITNYIQKCAIPEIFCAFRRIVYSRLI